MRAGGLPFHLPHVGRNLQAPPNSKHGALAPTAKVSKVGLIESRKVGLRQGSKHITMDAIRVNGALMSLKVVNNRVSSSIRWHGRGKWHVRIGGLNRSSGTRQQQANRE